jgi:hypothetical protein
MKNYFSKLTLEQKKGHLGLCVLVPLAVGLYAVFRRANIRNLYV